GSGPAAKGLADLVEECLGARPVAGFRCLTGDWAGGRIAATDRQLSPGVQSVFSTPVFFRLPSGEGVLCGEVSE
ncbi:MAG: hypothetical protein QXS54_08275, partial [Candidatus Methanomethylicaceae archaeon]